MFGHLRQRWLSIGAEEAQFARRGFAPAPEPRQTRLEQIGEAFVAGYNAALRLGYRETLTGVLGQGPAEFAGFRFEGAAMALALLDLLSPWRSRRFARFVADAASHQVYMAHVGAGWALARTSPRLSWRLGPLDPLLRWLLIDGVGFHAGYFDHRRAIHQQRRARGLRGCAGRVFDQGLGRSVWFAAGADIATAAGMVTAFAEPRRADLWSGVGLAAAYAGGVGAGELAELAARAGRYRICLAQGAAFAAKARERAGIPAEHTDDACRAFGGLSAAVAAAITDQALVGLDLNRPDLAYLAWRQGIRRRIALHAGGETAR